MLNRPETTTAHYQKLRLILGEDLIDMPIESPFDFVQQAKQGIASRAIQNFRFYFQLPIDETATMLNISEPTIYRWIRTNRKLEKIYAIRLFEVADLFLFGTEVFGSEPNFVKWLDLPNIALGGMKPRTLIESPNGISRTRDLLGRIEYGINS